MLKKSFLRLIFGKPASASSMNLSHPRKSCGGPDRIRSEGVKKQLADPKAYERCAKLADAFAELPEFTHDATEALCENWSRRKPLPPVRKSPPENTFILAAYY